MSFTASKSGQWGDFPPTALKYSLKCSTFCLVCISLEVMYFSKDYYLSYYDHVILHTGPFAMALSSIFWTQTLLNGTFCVHFERRSARREHAGMIPSTTTTPTPTTSPPPNSLIIEGELMAYMGCGTSSWACHNKTGLHLHTYLNWMSLQAGDRVFYYNSHLLGHLLALPNGRNVSQSCRCLCKVLRTVSFLILTKLNESKSENVCKPKKDAYLSWLWAS